MSAPDAKKAAYKFLRGAQIIATSFASLYHSSVIGSSYEKTDISGYLVFYLNADTNSPTLIILNENSNGETCAQWIDVLPRYHRFYGQQESNYIVYDCCNFEASNALIFESDEHAQNFYEKLSETFKEEYNEYKLPENKERPIENKAPISVAEKRTNPPPPPPSVRTIPPPPPPSITRAVPPPPPPQTVRKTAPPPPPPASIRKQPPTPPVSQNKQSPTRSDSNQSEPISAPTSNSNSVRGKKDKNKKNKNDNGDSNISGPTCVKKQASVCVDKETGQLLLNNFDIDPNVIEGYADSVVIDVSEKQPMNETEKVRLKNAVIKSFEDPDVVRKFIGELLKCPDPKDIYKMLVPKRVAPKPPTVRTTRNPPPPPSSVRAPPPPSPNTVRKANPPPPPSSVRKANPPPPPPITVRKTPITNENPIINDKQTIEEEAETGPKPSNTKALPNALQDSIRMFSKGGLKKVENNEPKAPEPVAEVAVQFDLTASISSFLAKRRKCISDDEEDEDEEEF